MFLGACLLISFVAQSVGLVVGAAMNVQVCKNDHLVKGGSHNVLSCVL
jgi:hypothetical protein